MVESGTNRGSWTYQNGDILRVERVGTTVVYKRNATVFYTSTVPSTGVLIADAAFNREGAIIHNARIVSPLIVMPVSAITATTAGTATAVATTGTTIDLSMPYTTDDNANNTYTVEYKLSSSGTWLDWGANPKSHTATPYADTITGLTEAASYDVRLTYNDTNGVNGTNPQTVSSIVMPVNATAAGTATAVAATDTTIDLSMPYSADGNADNTYTVEYRLSSSATWLDWGTNPKAHTASPYEDTITGLTAGENYAVRLTYNDADGVSGTNPQTISPIVMSANATAAGAATAVAASETAIAISMPYSVDGNANNTYTVEYKLSSEPTVWTTWVAGAVHAASPYTDTITA